ncbi:Uncharacterised protein [uncultured archaeon]|nr:Uncharacterised protein [uncultured archaeon]
MGVFLDRFIRLSLVAILFAVLVIGPSLYFSAALVKNKDALTLIFTECVAFATIIYAGLTWQLVDETRAMRKLQSTPNVSVYIEPREEWINFIDLKIMNFGPGAAYDVTFSLDKDLEVSKGKFLSQILSNKKIPYMGPNQKLQFFLTSLAEDFETKFKNPFVITVKYTGKDREEYKESFTIDFSQFYGFSQLGEPPLYQISKNIEIIQRALSGLSDGSRRPEVVTYTKKELERERRERHKKSESIHDKQEKLNRI